NPDLWTQHDGKDSEIIAYLDPSNHECKVCRDPSEEQFRLALLKRLRFAEIDDRYDQISPAWQKTYDWIFQDPDKRGTKIQMSQTGLLRTLLAQILESSPLLTARLFPNRRFLFWLFNDMPLAFRWSELVDAVKRLKTDAVRGEKFCFLVDGLDEFDGDHLELVRLLQDLSKHPRMKICVASRPWPVFEDAFKHRPSLMLQHLTYPDMKHYILSSFADHEGYKEFTKEEPAAAATLLEGIVNKASGVFLWTVMVVRSLLAGLTNGDRGADLQRRLDQLPPDLDHLYRKILGDLDPLYLEQAARLFRIMCATLEPPSLLCLSFAEQQQLTEPFVANLKNLDESQQIARATRMRRRLMSRCKGLLEVDQYVTKSEGLEWVTVHFFHRTVKDFFRDQKVMVWLAEACKKPFDPLISLSRAYVLVLPLDAPTFSRTVCLILSYVRQAGKSPAMQQFQVLDQLDIVAERCLGWRYGSFVAEDLIASLPGVSRSDPRLISNFASPTLFLAALFNVHAFLSSSTRSPISRIKSEYYPLLLRVAVIGIQPAASFVDTTLSVPAPNVESVKIILEQGQSFRQMDAIREIWAQRQAYIPLPLLGDHNTRRAAEGPYSEVMEITVERWLQSMRLLARYGPDLKKDWESELGSDSIVWNNLEWRSKLHEIFAKRPLTYETQRQSKSTSDSKPRFSLKKSNPSIKPRWRI
ncbi:MAG: hypothetical protein Q9165_006599, partial [Trypethelium subeluteriae]